MECSCPARASRTDKPCRLLSNVFRERRPFLSHTLTLSLPTRLSHPLARSIHSTLVRQEASGRRAGDHVMRRVVHASLDQPLGPVAHDRQRQAQETQHRGGERQQTGQQTGPHAHRILPVVRVVSGGPCDRKNRVVNYRSGRRRRRRHHGRVVRTGGRTFRPETTD